MPKLNGRTGMLPPLESGQQSKRVHSVGGNENRQGDNSLAENDEEESPKKEVDVQRVVIEDKPIQ